MTRARDVANLIGSGNFSSTTFTATAGQTAFTISHTQGFIQVFMNGLLLDETVDYTSNGSAVTLTSGAAAGDEIEVVAYNTFSVGDALNQAAADTRYVNTTGDTMTGDLNIQSGAISSLALTGSTRSDLFLIDSAAPTDQKRKTIRSDGGNLVFGTENDAINSFTTSLTMGSDGLDVAGKLEADYFQNTAVATYNITGSYTAGTNYVFTTRTAINALGKGNGFYKFLVYSDLYGAGLSHYTVYSSYDTFYFVNTGSNTNIRQTLAWAGINMGHAPNTGNRAIDIKLHHPYGSDSTYPANQKFEFSPLVGLSGLDGSAGKNLIIYLYKVG